MRETLRGLGSVVQSPQPLPLQLVECESSPLLRDLRLDASQLVALAVGLRAHEVQFLSDVREHLHRAARLLLQAGDLLHARLDLLVQRAVLDFQLRACVGKGRAGGQRVCGV